MRFGALPGPNGSHSQRPRSSPAHIVASHLLTQMRRPGRVRSRLVLLTLTVTSILFVIYGWRHTRKIQITAVGLTHYIPTSIDSALGPYGLESSGTGVRWTDFSLFPSSSSPEDIANKPKFHLRIAAHKASPNLCRTLLSAAVNGYPPPTLANWNGTANPERPGLNAVREMLAWLRGQEVGGEDLVGVFDENTILQLPPTILLPRYLHALEGASLSLLHQYGHITTHQNGSRIPKHQQPQRFNASVLFAAGVPPSQSQSQAQIQAPIANIMMMGKAAALTPLFERAAHILASGEVGEDQDQQDSSSAVFARIFAEQELSRTRTSSDRNGGGWIQRFFSRPVASPPAVIANVTIEQGRDYEFGIALDGDGGVFSDFGGSWREGEGEGKERKGKGKEGKRRFQFLTFNNPASLKYMVHLPPDLRDTVVSAGPLLPLSASASSSSLYQKGGKKGEEKEAGQGVIARARARWAEVSLATDLAEKDRTGAVVPAVFSVGRFGGERETGGEEMWKEMWFYNFSSELREGVGAGSVKGPLCGCSANGVMKDGDSEGCSGVF